MDNYTVQKCLVMIQYILCGINHWRIFRGTYRKLVWLGFESMTPDALTDWAIRPWVQLALRANFVQLLQFHPFFQCSHFISAIAFVSRHICFKQNLAQVYTYLIILHISSIHIHIYIYILYLYMYMYTYIRICNRKIGRTIELKHIYLIKCVYSVVHPCCWFIRHLRHLRNLKNTFLCEVAQIYSKV